MAAAATEVKNTDLFKSSSVCVARNIAKAFGGMHYQMLVNVPMQTVDGRTMQTVDGRSMVATVPEQEAREQGSKIEPRNTVKGPNK